MVTYHCDRCGKECSRAEVGLSHVEYAFLGVSQTEDLCKECFGEYQRGLDVIRKECKAKINQFRNEFTKGV
jgi:hypothetical protein